MTKMTKSNWPFDDPPDVDTITVREIVEGACSILRVTRDAEHGRWQFLSRGDLDIDDAMVVGLGEMFDHDSTIAEIADLEPGWSATREEVGATWRRSEHVESTSRTTYVYFFAHPSCEPTVFFAFTDTPKNLWEIPATGIRWEIAVPPDAVLVNANGFRLCIGNRTYAASSVLLMAQTRILGLSVENVREDYPPGWRTPG